MTGQQNQAFGAKMKANKQKARHFARQTTDGHPLPSNFTPATGRFSK